MIGYVSTGKSFASLAQYLEWGAGDTCPPGRVKWFETRNLLARTMRDAAGEMHDEALLNERVQRPVYHVVVSFDPEDTVDKALMLAVADRVLSDFDLAQHQALIVAHGDTYYEHMHLMINRVNWVTGEASKTAFDYYRLEKALRELERELGLKETPGRHYRLDGQSYAGGQSHRRLRGEARRHAREALRKAQSWEDLAVRLASRGLALHVARRALYVTDGTRTARAGALVRGGSLVKLEERFGDRFDAWRKEAGNKRYETNRELTMEGAEQETRPGAGQGRGVAEALADEAVSTPPAADPRGTRSDKAAQAVLDDLRAHSEVVGLSTRRSALIGTASALEASLAQLQEQMEALRVEDARLDRYFREIFRKPMRARAAFDAEAVLLSPQGAAERLRTAPDAFGTLRGGVVGSERQRALETAQAASVLGKAYHTGMRRLAEEPDRVQPARTATQQGLGGAPTRAPEREVVGQGGGAVPDAERTSAFYERLALVYQDPDRAWQAYGTLEQRLGPERAARVLTERPEALGTLRRGLDADVLRRHALQAAAAGVERSRQAGGDVTEPLAWQERRRALGARLEHVHAEIGTVSDRLAVLPRRRDIERGIATKMAALSPSQRADVLRRVGEAGASLAKMTAGVAVRGAELATRAVTRQAMGRDVFER